MLFEVRPEVAAQASKAGKRAFMGRHLTGFRAQGFKGQGALKGFSKLVRVYGQDVIRDLRNSCSIP